MNHCSILPLLKLLASLIGRADKYNADCYLAQEVLSTRKSLPAFLDYFHPHPIVFSAGVERLVRSLVITEEALSL